MALNLSAFGVKDTQNTTGLNLSAFENPTDKLLKSPAGNILDKIKSMPAQTIGTPTGPSISIPLSKVKDSSDIKLPFTDIYLKNPFADKPLEFGGRSDNALSGLTKYMLELPEKLVSGVTDLGKPKEQTTLEQFTAPRISTYGEDWKKLGDQYEASGVAHPYVVAGVQTVSQGILDATYVGGLVENGAQAILRRTISSPSLELSSQTFKGLTQEESVAILKSRLLEKTKEVVTNTITPQGTLSKAGVSKLETLANETNKLFEAVTGNTIPVLNRFGTILDDMALTATRPIGGIGKVPTKPFPNRPIPAPEASLPGYRPVPGQAPAFGLSTQNIEPVGFGSSKVPNNLAPLAKTIIARGATKEEFLSQITAGLNSQNLTTRETVQNVIREMEAQGTNPEKFYDDTNKLAQAHSEILTKFELSTTGLKPGTGDGVVRFSTFPKDWDPNLRDTELMNLVRDKYLGDGTLESIQIPPKNNVRQRALVDQYLIELEKYGIDVSSVRNKLNEQTTNATNGSNARGAINAEEIANKTFGEKPVKIVQQKLSAADKLNRSMPSQKTTEGRQTKQVINKSISPTSPDITRTEKQLLNEKLKQQSAGARVGYKAGQLEAKTSITNQLKNTFENKVSEIKRDNELDRLKTNIKTRDFDRVRAEIVDYIKSNIPLSDRGVFLNMIKDAKTQADLVRAFTRIDKKANDILVKEAIATLKKTVAKMSESNAISADYRNKIKDVIDSYELSGHTKVTIEKLQATQDYINRQASMGENVDLPQRIVDKLKILERTPKGELTLGQLQGLQSEVELLARLGETKWASKQALYEAEKDLRKQELLSSVSPIESTKAKNIGFEKDPKKYADTFIKVRNYAQKTQLGLTPINGLADITGMTPLKNVMDLDFGNYLTYNDDVIKQWYELTKDFDETNFKRIGGYAISKQSGGTERLLSNGFTQEMIDGLKLTDQELKAYDFVRNVFDSEFPAVKKYALDVYNKDVGQVDNYVSFMSDNDAMNELELYERFGPSNEFSKNTKTVEQGYTEKRAETAEYKIEMNIDRIFRRHIDDVAYMLTMGKDIKQYFEIVNSPELKAKLGDMGALAWLQYLDMMARKGGSEGAKRIAALDFFRKNMAAGVLAFRLSSTLVQLTSFADTMATIGAEWAMKGASSIATSKEWRIFVMDNFHEVKKAVGDDVAFREFGEGFLGKASRVGMTPLQTMDGLMRSTAIAGAYQKLAAGKGIIINLNNPDKDLIQQSTRLMQQSQGSSFFKDQPLSITTNFGLADNKSVNKFILTFQSFMLNRWDNIQRQIWRLGIKEKNYKKASMSFLWMILVATAMEEGIRRGTKKILNTVTGQEDQEPTPLSEAMVLNAVQSVPIAGQLVSSLMYSSNPVPVINTFEQTLSGLSSVWNGKALRTKIRGGVTAAGGIGSLSGVPGSSQFADIIKGFIKPVNAKSTGGIQIPNINIPSIKIPNIKI